MASKRGILAVAFLFFTLLPFLASAFFPVIPEFSDPDQDFINPPRNHEINEFPQHKKGDDSVFFIKPDLNKLPPFKQDKPAFGFIPEQGLGNGGLAAGFPPAKQGLQEGFYEESCPQAERIVNRTIRRHFRKDPKLAPALIRLFFHDCFVTGCDASILLDVTPTGEDVEKKAPQNGPFIRGFEVIDDIKAQLEAECPGVVSCADVLAFANRDSLVFTGVPSYEVAAGRRDGLASLAENCKGNLPFPETSAEENIQMFQRKGMTLEELVVLTGAHSIGSAHCNIVSHRFHDPHKAKDIDPGYLFTMQTLTSCRTDNQDVPFDAYSQHKMDSRYYKELLKRRALLESDANLAKDLRTRGIMHKFVNNQIGWLARFTSAIKKLGKIEVLTGNQGEIRKQCRAVN